MAQRGTARRPDPPDPGGSAWAAVDRRPSVGNLRGGHPSRRRMPTVKVAVAMTVPTIQHLGETGPEGRT